MPVFLAPLYILGAAIAAAPVIMHLLHRRRPKPVPFSTLRFLRQAVARTRRSRHLTHVLTLLMRVLILLLLALAFARPKFRYAPWLPPGARTVVIVLDGSASMRVQRGDQTAFEIGRDWALELVKSLASGDRVGVVVPGVAQPQIAFPPVSDQARIAELLNAQAPGYARVDMVAALEDVCARLEFGRGFSGLEIHVFSDFQESGWDGARAEELAAQLADSDILLFCNRLAPAVAGNAGIEKVTFSPPAILGDGELRVGASVRASHDMAGENTARLVIDRTEAATDSFTLHSGESSSVRLPAMIAGGSGEYVTGSLSIVNDILNIDDVYNFSLPRIAGVPALLVEGGNGAGGPLRDTFFLKHALQPGARRSTILLPEVSDWQTFLNADLNRYKVIFLSNPPVLAGTAAAKLDTFARNGGHVLVFPGEAGNLSDQLTALAPLAGLSVASEEYPEPKVTGILSVADPAELAARITRVFPLPYSLTVRKRLRFDELPDGVEGILRFEAGQPLLLQADHGQGTVYACSVSASRDWSELPLSPLFVVMIQEITRDCVQQNLRYPMTTVGDSLALPWTGAENGESLQLTGPDGVTRQVDNAAYEQADVLLLTGFDLPGFYRLTAGGRSIPIAVNSPPAEGWLNYLTPERVEADLRAATLYQAETWDQQREQLVNVRQGRPLWPFLLAAALLLALVEEIFANYQSRTERLPKGLAQIVGGGQKTAAGAIK